MVDAIAIVSDPTVVQFAPSIDAAAVIVVPARVSFTKYGAVPAGPLVLVETSAVLTRRWKASPLPGLTSINAWREPGSSDSRIITPAFVQFATKSSVATFVTIVPSPVIVV